MLKENQIWQHCTLEYWSVIQYEPKKNKKKKQNQEYIVVP